MRQIDARWPGGAARIFARETCFWVVLLLGYRIFGAFGPWKDVWTLPYSANDLLAVRRAWFHSSLCCLASLWQAKAARTKAPTTDCLVAWAAQSSGS